MENEFRYEATGQRYIPNEEGLTLASYINNPRQLLTKAVGLLNLDADDSSVPPPQDEEGGVAMDTEEVGVAGDSQGKLTSFLSFIEGMSFVERLSLVGHHFVLCRGVVLCGEVVLSRRFRCEMYHLSLCRGQG